MSESYSCTYLFPSIYVLYCVLYSGRPTEELIINSQMKMSNILLEPMLRHGHVHFFNCEHKYIVFSRSYTSFSTTYFPMYKFPQLNFFS